MIKLTIDTAENHSKWIDIGFASCLEKVLEMVQYLYDTNEITEETYTKLKRELVCIKELH